MSLHLPSIFALYISIPEFSQHNAVPTHHWQMYKGIAIPRHTEANSITIPFTEIRPTCLTCSNVRATLAN